jgi:hypothetical protein
MRMRTALRAGCMTAGLIAGQLLMTDAAFAETVSDAVSAPKYEGECLAAYRMANQIKRGGTFYEDFSYPHASQVVSDNNDALADYYYNGGGQFDRAQIRAWLQNQLTTVCATGTVVLENTDTAVMA